MLTADGQTHIAKWLRLTELGELDLAVVQFTSLQSYRVAVRGNSQGLSVGDAVYAAGFPNWHWSNAKTIENTREWGLKAFRLTTGRVGMLPELLVEGYQLGYTNDIAPGMSGRPVLDKYGKLVAINGRVKYPLAGIEVFKFADNSLPSPAVFQQMEALIWAIPIEIFQQQLSAIYFTDILGFLLMANS